jgi:hypothetical protein
MVVAVRRLDAVMRSDGAKLEPYHSKKEEVDVESRTDLFVHTGAPENAVWKVLWKV